MNSLKRGKDIILQTTTSEDPTFNHYKGTYDSPKKSISKVKSLADFRKQNESLSKNFHIIDLQNYQHGQTIDKEIFSKLPEYYHKAANKYLRLHLKSSRNKSSGNPSQSKASSRTEVTLPFLKNTSQGNFI